jgi:hypothetical protein
MNRNAHRCLMYERSSGETLMAKRVAVTGRVYGDIRVKEDVVSYSSQIYVAAIEGGRVKAECAEGVIRCI